MPDTRQHPRFRLSLSVAFALPTGLVHVDTVGISRTGVSVRLTPPPAIGDVIGVTLTLPNRSTVSGNARCKTHMSGQLCGLTLEFAAPSQAVWEAFIDEEESTGALWRMIGRIADAPDDALAPRGVTVTSSAADGGKQLRFHTAGENGLAWQLAFQKHPCDPAEACDLCVSLPGFREPGRRLVRRVLRDDVTLRLDASMAPFRARIVELNRGGYAYVQVDPIGLVSLGVGELLLVSSDGASAFPHFSALELEQIACDTFRNDLTRPLFAAPAARVPPPVPLPPIVLQAPVVDVERVPSRRFRDGFDAVRFAQAAAADAQRRRYGQRDIFFHPSVWAKVVVDNAELMGPTMQDEGHVCVLALVGPGAPRVVRLSPSSTVSLLKPPSK